jgi:sugar O-acyltransferase (sialic acid O-acetyltransferase NeuD family)
MPRSRILIFGASGHGAVVADAIEAAGSHELAGFVDSTKAVGELVLGYPVLGGEADLPALVEREMVSGLVVAIGDNWRRSEVVRRATERLPWIQFPSVIHPAAVVSRSAAIGPGSVLLAGAVVNCRATVGRFCLLNTASSLDHDCHLGDFASLAPRASIGGGTSIGSYSAISLGASVVHKLSLGSHCVVGAGSVVVRDLPDNVLAYGCPAKVIRERGIDEQYL